MITPLVGFLCVCVCVACVYACVCVEEERGRHIKISGNVIITRSLFILCNVVIHHDNNLLVWNSMGMEDLIGMACISLNWETQYHRRNDVQCHVHQVSES